LRTQKGSQQTPNTTKKNKTPKPNPNHKQQKSQTPQRGKKKNLRTRYESFKRKARRIGTWGGKTSEKGKSPTSEMLQARGEIEKKRTKRTKKGGMFLCSPLPKKRTAKQKGANKSTGEEGSPPISHE